MLCSGLSNFNKVASEKFEELDDDEKSRLAEIAENDPDTVLTDQQTDNIISDIFSQLRDNTVIIYMCVCVCVCVLKCWSVEVQMCWSLGTGHKV